MELTPALLRVQFGALAAAGFSPGEVMKWTWPQVLSWSACVQAYHLDLFARVVSGKSPSMEEAKKAGRKRAEAEAFAEMLRASNAGPDEIRSAAAAAVQASDRMKIANLAAAGFHVTTEVDPGLVGLDLFAEFRRRKAAARSQEGVRAPPPPER